jgi:hypothetical protein
MSNEHGEAPDMVKLIWKTTLWLSIITVAEIVLAVTLTDFFTAERHAARAECLLHHHESC